MMPEKTHPQRRATVAAAAALALAAALATGMPGLAEESAAVPAHAFDADRVTRGRYLVTITGCNDCHTPLKMGANGPEPDMSRMLSGHPEGLEVTPPPDLGRGPWMWSGVATNTAFAGPWGISYSANLTPDEATGLGIWTEEMFVKALRTGKHFGQSRPILPPMPWPWYGRMTDDDLAALYAYLRTVPPIVNHVPDPVPPPAATAAEKAPAR
jgi:mono/diheme cytochrome c family protein